MAGAVFLQCSVLIAMYCQYLSAPSLSWQHQAWRESCETEHCLTNAIPSAAWRRRNRRRKLWCARAARDILALISPPPISRERILRHRHFLRAVPREPCAVASCVSAPRDSQMFVAGDNADAKSSCSLSEFADVAAQTDCDVFSVAYDLARPSSPSRSSGCLRKMPLDVFAIVALEVRRRLPHISWLLSSSDAFAPSSYLGTAPRWWYLLESRGAGYYRDLPMICDSAAIPVQIGARVSPDVSSSPPPLPNICGFDNEVLVHFCDLCASSEPSPCPRCGVLEFWFLESNDAHCGLCERVSELAMACSACKLVYCPPCAVDEVDDG